MNEIDDLDARAQSDGATVVVLLATYNGARFVREQIDSVLAQTYRPLRILARDDGSGDGTRAILENYAARFGERFRLLPAGEPSGSAKGNFHRLLRAALEEAGDAAYFAFADQDDFWIPEKIALEMSAMRELESRRGEAMPLLVFSDLRPVQEDRTVLHESFWEDQGIDPENIHRFRRLLSQNVVTGCTAVFNVALARLASRMPADAYMHDWWMALLAAGFGDAAIVRTATVEYRQHGGNVLGMVEAPANHLVPKWRFHKERRVQWEMAAHQAQALRRVHGAELPERKRRTLARYLRCEESPRRVARVWNFLVGGFYFNTLRGNLAMAWYLWDMKWAKEHPDS